MSAPARIDLCSTGDVEPGVPLRVENAGLALAVFNLDGEFYVTDDQCTHGPGLLSEGFVEGDVVECNFHNGQFNIKTGEVVSPPCMVPIKTYKTTVENGRVLIETEG
jgi:nitrite reductase/ring-hydroxylating ferredoxin subunit